MKVGGGGDGNTLYSGLFEVYRYLVFGAPGRLYSYSWQHLQATLQGQELSAICKEDFLAAVLIGRIGGHR
ncbi:hypothetical protein NC652_019951 [Populus alba x Populus x berolinensis]|nr:hypothetical protein NC652_019951 [Populus alba x Populus x berolinensis]